ncbi:MAG TPA: hypothetical protein DD719_07955 [Desulfotomaculum sp.]|nr:hypothetical protein [Desulfotomaculum sp.]
MSNRKLGDSSRAILSCPGKKKSESKPETIEEGSYDILTVQELLGHSDVKATIIYTHVLN